MIILAVIIGWLILFIATATLATNIQDKSVARRERKIIEEYEKEFD